MVERLFFGSVCSDITRIDQHISKHRLSMSRERYLEIAQEISEGRQGIYTRQVKIQEEVFQPYFVVIKGIINQDEKEFGIVRSVRKCGQNEFISLLGRIYVPTCNKHSSLPYAHGFCPFCKISNKQRKQEEIKYNKNSL